MDKDEFLRLAEGFYDAVHDRNNFIKPNSRDLEFVISCMQVTRSRQAMDLFFTSCKERVAIIKSIHSHILESTVDPDVLELWQDIQTPQLWAMLFTISLEQLQNIKNTLLENNLEVESLTMIWGNRLRQLKEKLCAGQGNIVDSLQNVICLSSDLHKMWSKTEFAFLPEEAKQIDGGWSIRLRFCWMENVQPIEEKSFSEVFFSSPYDIIDAYRRIPEGTIAAVQLKHSTPILDGKIITIQAAKKEHLPDYEILRLQCDIIRIASICAGGNQDDDVVRDDYEEFPAPGDDIAFALEKLPGSPPKTFNQSSEKVNDEVEADISAENPTVHSRYVRKGWGSGQAKTVGTEYIWKVEGYHNENITGLTVERKLRAYRELFQSINDMLDSTFR
ncbi:hypothetical protein ACHAQH_001759 [Verticillium albo-atrum]